MGQLFTLISICSHPHRDLGMFIQHLLSWFHMCHLQISKSVWIIPPFPCKENWYPHSSAAHSSPLSQLLPCDGPRPNRSTHSAPRNGWESQPLQGGILILFVMFMTNWGYIMVYLVHPPNIPLIWSNKNKRAKSWIDPVLNHNGLLVYPQQLIGCLNFHHSSLTSGHRLDWPRTRVSPSLLPLDSNMSANCFVIPRITGCTISIITTKQMPNMSSLLTISTHLGDLMKIWKSSDESSITIFVSDVFWHASDFWSSYQYKIIIITTKNYIIIPNISQLWSLAYIIPNISDHNWDIFGMIISS